MTTYPYAFNAQLTEKNAQVYSLVKPAIRLIKRWNAKNYHPYDSYQLEKRIAALPFTFCYTLPSVFKHIVDNLSEYDFAAEYKKAKVRTLKSRIKTAYDDEAAGYKYLPEQELKKVFN